MSKAKELSQLANKVEYDDGTNKIRIDAVQVPQSIFKTIAIAGQSSVEADTTSDTLTLVAGTNMTLTTDAGTDTITLASSGSGGKQNLFSTVAVAGQNSIVADSTTDTLTLAAGSNITLTTDQATDTLTITSTAGSGTLSNIVEDTSPQLGGNLESNTFEIQMADNNKIALGTGERGYLQHTGASGKVQLFSTTGGIDIRTTANDETIAISSDDGSGGIANYIIADGSTGQTELYHYGSKKFQTESTGARVEGDLTVSNNLTVTGDILSVVDIDSIKNIKLPVSAPFHCNLMSKASKVMREEIEKINFQNGKNILISNVTADEISNIVELKSLLISQIEKRVRWRESILNMINKGVSQFIEIGPGKVLSGLVKRINKDVKISSINSQSDIESLNI